MAITEKREASDYEAPSKLFAYSQQRFGDERLRWTLPSGWAQAERSQMRPLNLRFGPNQEGECYLSMLPGGAGGTAANVNRWRKQMGAEPLSDAEIEALPEQMLMGIPGVRVGIDGAYTPVGAAAPLPDQRMIGIVATMGDVGLFVKMVGPRGLVAANESAFDEFVKSLELRMPSGM